MTTELAEIAARVAGWARPGEQVEAYVSRGQDTEVEVYDGDIESISSAESAGIGVRVVAGSRQGFAYAGALDTEAFEETLAEARDNATFASEDPWVGLAEPDGVPSPGLDLWRDSLASLSADEKVSQALELERTVRAADPRIRQVETAQWGDSSVEAAVATSTGISVYDRGTSCYLVVSAVAAEGDDTQTGYGYSVGRSPEEIELSKAATDAVERATRLLGATKPASAHLTVLFEPRITATLLSILAGTLDGESVLKGRSMFADRLGEEVSVPALTLVDDPTDAESFGARNFDGEGLATRRNVLVCGGVLQMFLYNTYAARRAGTVSTGSARRGGFKGMPGTGARALTVVPGVLSPEKIVADTDDGFLVQSVTGVHSGVNAISGDFSVGAEGLRIRNGAIAGPVREVTVASTVQRMLRSIVAVGSDLERLPGSAAGVTLAIADMAMSGG